MTASRPVAPVIPAASPGRRPGKPGAGRPLPLASPPGRPDVVSGFGRIDASGRVDPPVTSALVFPHSGLSGWPEILNFRTSGVTADT
jgi:hypothetical protein